MQAGKRIAIVGGGISGLAAAHEIARRHPSVAFRLYEASARLGGIVETVQAQGFTIECGPDSWVTEKPWARELAEELGLAEQVMASNDHQRRTYIAKEGRLVAMPDGMRMMVPTRWEPLVHSELLSWQGRLAYLREPGRAAELKRNALLLRGEDADESVAAFVVRHFGEEATRTLAGPLLAGVFGGDIHRLSVRAVMAPFVRMEAETGSLVEALRARALQTNPQSTAKAATFTTLENGLGTLIDRIAGGMPGECVQRNCTVRKLSRQGSQWTVTTASGEANVYDAVLLATPAHVTRALLVSTTLPVAQEIADLLPVEASSAVVTALGYLPAKAAALRIPRGFGFLVPQGRDPVKEEPRLLAATFVDQKFNHRAPAGAVLLRGFFGGAAAAALAHADDRSVEQATRQQLGQFLGPLPPADVTVVRRWPQSLPQYFVGHGARIARAEQLLVRLAGLSLVGSAYHGVGLPDLVREARLAVKAVLSVPTEEGVL